MNLVQNYLLKPILPNFVRFELCPFELCSFRPSKLCSFRTLSFRTLFFRTLFYPSFQALFVSNYVLSNSVLLNSVLSNYVLSNYVLSNSVPFEVFFVLFCFVSKVESRTNCSIDYNLLTRWWWWDRWMKAVIYFCRKVKKKVLKMLTHSRVFSL